MKEFLMKLWEDFAKVAAMEYWPEAYLATAAAKPLLKEDKPLADDLGMLWGK